MSGENEAFIETRLAHTIVYDREAQRFLVKGGLGRHSNVRRFLTLAQAQKHVDRSGVVEDERINLKVAVSSYSRMFKCDQWQLATVVSVGIGPRLLRVKFEDGNCKNVSCDSVVACADRRELGRLNRAERAIEKVRTSVISSSSSLVRSGSRTLSASRT